MAQRQQEDLSKLKRMSMAMQGFRQMPPTQLQDTINTMRTGIAGMGGDGVDTLEEVELLEQAETLLSNMNTQIAKDPLSHAIKLDIVFYAAARYVLAWLTRRRFADAS